MSEASQTETPSPMSVDELRAMLATFMALIDRLALLQPQPRRFVPSTLDQVMTAEQFAEWFQLEKKTVNEKAKLGMIPAMPVAENRFRFHARSVLDHLHALLATPEGRAQYRKIFRKK